MQFTDCMGTFCIIFSFLSPILFLWHSHANASGHEPVGGKERTIMNIMDSIAATSVSMSAASLQQSVSLAVTKKVMDSQDLALQELTKMLPATPAPAKGAYIDTYA